MSRQASILRKTLPDEYEEGNANLPHHVTRGTSPSSASLFIMNNPLNLNYHDIAALIGADTYSIFAPPFEKGYKHGEVAQQVRASDS